MRPNETYDDTVVRLFLLAAAVWGIVGMAIGVLRRGARWSGPRSTSACRG